MGTWYMLVLWEWDHILLVINIAIIVLNILFLSKVISFAASKSGFDGTDVRLLKFLANKFGFSYNITKPDSYYGAIKMVFYLIFFLQIVVMF